ncbi:hypothetical protein ABVS_2815 [Acinetobacter lwoffii]|uniref:helix-turn-helix domain-containing protein n=1 Tax=Acinetobacter TaxID=469 RepID=UPI000869AD61|nr:XRE family transcriptional regulator [Acinetobacter lwoffii]ODN54881.1 hypothetical protein A9Z54_07985 [Acinetobacter sp. 51m]QZM13442.1 hypothetical protein ABVS_2815 [Acinetobacter lwoffii]
MQGIEQFQSGRLKRARLMYDGLTKAALAEMINVSPSTLTKWEDGTHFPQNEAIEKLSEALKIPYHWFLRPIPNQGSPLFLNRAKKRLLKAPGDRSNEMLLNLSEIYHIAAEWINFPEVNLIESLSRTEALLLTHHQIEEIASKLREHWGVGISPIQDLTKRIEKSGVIVTRFEIGYDDMDGSSAWINDRPFIFIAADKDNYFRSRFDISHELGHLIMHKNLTQEDKKVRFDLLEEQAHYFASCLLFPPNAFIAEANKISIESLTMLKKRWGISIAAMIYKAESMKMISSDEGSRLWRSLRYRGYHKCEPYDVETKPEQPVALKNSIKLMLEQGGFSKSKIIDEFGLKKHLEVLCGLASGYLDEDFGQIISMKSKNTPSSTNATNLHKRQGELIKFSRD